MNFIHAMELCRSGKKVKRERYIATCWVEYSELHNVFLHHVSGNDYQGPLFMMDDFLATDWAVIKDR
jgi:hypothetical protein